MQYVSTEYKDAMKQLARNKSYMKINIGLINQKAQENSAVQPGGFTYFSNLKKPLDNESVSKKYATFERGYTQADGSKYFLPREHPGAYIPRRISPATPVTTRRASNSKQRIRWI